MTDAIGSLDVAWAVADRPRSGENVSGDRHLVQRRGEQVLAVVVDGLGHGPVAAEAAERALAALAGSKSWHLVDMFQLCHLALSGSRGVVMSAAVLDLQLATVTWSGIGNVEGVVITPGRAGKDSLTTRSGVVGYDIPRLYAPTHAIAPGSCLVLATDGIKPGFDTSVRPGEAPERSAQRILADHGHSNDDALVLVLLTRDGRSHVPGP